MTHEQAASEIHYRLCKFLLQNLREAGIITADEESECRQQLIREIQPFIGVFGRRSGMREKVITRIEPNVTIIPKLQPMTRRKRVAAYARVSTSSDEQMKCPS